MKNDLFDQWREKIIKNPVFVGPDNPPYDTWAELDEDQRKKLWGLSIFLQFRQEWEAAFNIFWSEPRLHPDALKIAGEMLIEAAWALKNDPNFEEFAEICKENNLRIPS